MDMKKKAAKVIGTTLMAVTVTAAFSGAAYAYNKCGGTTMAVVNVTSELLVRGSASASGEVVGYLPSASGVLVESMNEEWTKITSGSVSGYVKTECLAFDETAQELLEVYGVTGAVASWDDVKLFSDPENSASIIGSLNEGEGYEVIGSTDNWVEVQLDDGTVAYLAAEDVTITKVLDTGVSQSDTGSVQAAEETAAQPETESYAEYGYTEESYTDYSYTETDYTPETESYTETESYAAYTYTETETADTSAYTESYSYTEETAAETKAAASTETSDDDDGITGDEYIDPSTEAVSATETEDTSSTGSSGTSYTASDVDLLAALIYCEAGNQSEEGKIAVGQVVMNRVASSSFANTISGVIYESGQFTPAMDGTLDSVIGTSAVTDECYSAAIAALNGEGSVPDALYFNAGSGTGTQIGDHQFY